MAQRTLSSFFSKPEVAKANTESRAEVKGELHDSKENVEPQENLVPKAQPKAINPFFNKPKANGVSKASSKESCPSPTREAGAMEANAEPKEQAPKRPLESADVTEAKRPKTKEEADREDLRDSPPMNEDADKEPTSMQTDALLDEDDDELSDDGEETNKDNALKRLQASNRTPAEGSATAFNLAKLAKGSRYDPAAAATFKKGEKVPYMHLCKTFEQISQISARLDIILLLANCYRSIMALTPEDLLPAVYLSVNKIAPAHEGLELGVGDALLIKCIADSSGKTDKHVKQLYDKEGDLGAVAQSSKATQKTLIKPTNLTVRSVFQTLKDIALAQGKDSAKKRGDKIRTMLVASRETESQFIVRSLQGKMRIGLAEQSVLAALALALVMNEPQDLQKSAEKLQFVINDVTERLKMVYSEVPSYDIVIPRLVTNGAAGLNDKACRITNGLPVKPMLAKPTRGITEVLDRFTGIDFTCEFKYDGERAQIHYDSARPKGAQMAVYSRNSENHTTKYPDIIQRLPKAINSGVTSFILDSEVVAYDTEEGKIKPFQVLQHRGRKNIQLEDVKIHVCVFAFDLLYLNGESLLREPLVNRRARLHESFNVVPTEFTFATYSDGRDPEVIESFLQESIRENCEGLMVKTLKVDATYQPSKRSLNWLKVKKDYLKGMGDSLDLVPIGGYFGKGKRTGWYGGFLLACYEEESEEFQSICKIGTGFSEEALAKFKDEFSNHIIPGPKPYYRYCDDHKPDVWFDDAFVWEVLAADLSISPAHRAALGKVDPDKGIALRFPRFIRVREDKGPTQATDATQVAEMYLRQFQNQTK